MRNHRDTPGIHAGSMADIGFLLLIFFLVTTTIPDDKGIPQGLPQKCLQPPCAVEVAERNVMRIAINADGELLVNDEAFDLKNLKDYLKEFIDNNGDSSCTYCQGTKNRDYSDNPKKAVISLSSHRESSYKDYIAIQVELTAAYYELREAYVRNYFDKPVADLNALELKQVKEAYPLLLSEAELRQ